MKFLKDKKSHRILSIIIFVNIILFGFFVSLITYNKVSITNRNTNKIVEHIDNKININTCEIEDLTNLPSIGDKLAQRIIGNRPYRSIEDLDNVDKIGNKVMDNIRDKITVE